VTKHVGDRLPEPVLRAFDGEDLAAKVGPAYVLVTTDADGSPRPCMLSAGEIVATDDRRLRVGLWMGTRTTENLARGSSAVLVYVEPDVVLYVRALPRALSAATDERLARFELEVTSVESDVHPGMPVTQPIAFRASDHSADEVAADWRRQIDALRR
jgi:hypothetical protein